jgi:protein phosphatase
MGIVLPKPILSKVVERVGSNHVNSAISSINGYRNSMEDAHVMYIGPDRMVFGVFDGHSNDRCSAFIAHHIAERIQKLPLPLTNEALERLCLELDEQFLEEHGDGGTTGTFAIIEPGTNDYKVTICNVGDSRTIITRQGSLVFVTEDHKPANPGERDRIEKAGGTVRMNRVDGDLAVSRAFGDGFFKKNRDDARNQKVIAVPDITRHTCVKGDMIIIACDGVFEGNFSTEEVVAFCHQQCPPPGGDYAVLASRVVDQAVRRGSKDNITCMIVQFADGIEAVANHGARSFLPGPPYPRSHEGSKTAYGKMAAYAGLTSAEALKMRYDLLHAYLENRLNTLPPLMQLAFEMSDENDIDAEKNFFANGGGPPAGAEAQKAWFQTLGDLQ